MFGLFKKKPATPANVDDTDLLYEQTGQGRYRIYRDAYGRYIAQLKVSEGKGGHFYTDVNEYWKDVRVTQSAMYASRTEKEAEEAAVRHASERKKAWELRKSAGPVRELGKLP